MEKNSGGIYQNPVYPHYFADPFVWKHDGKYYAVGTDLLTPHVSGTGSSVSGEERAIPLLISDNFIDWKFHGNVLRVDPKFRGKEFWAPEVAFFENHFYIFYSSAAEGLQHQVRVAKSDSPTGPFQDVAGLIGGSDTCPFAIDAHPFQDVDGQWYLFYARDFLDASGPIRAGTALVVDRLIGMSKLAGEEKTVLRSKCNWQLFKSQREMYGKIWDWHTMEGPTVRKHDGRYYCFYSGGCYENETYGVDYGVADSVSGPYDDCGNESGPRVLKTVPGQVIGPGHNSIVLGPDNKTEYFVYHAWDPQMKARRMYLDKLVWTPEGPRCAGPTWTPQTVVG